MSQLNMELQEDYSQVTIDRICYRDNDDQVQLYCFQSAGTLRKFVSEFYEVTCEPYPSDIIKTEWKKALKYIDSLLDELEIGKIQRFVWIPCKSNCVKLLKSVIDQSISLSKVDETFLTHKSNISREVVLLYEGMKAITNSFSENNQMQVGTAVRKINDYWKVCRYYQVSHAFLELKKLLQLSGDFSAVEEFSQKVISIQD